VQVSVCDVGPRDGLQNEAETLARTGNVASEDLVWQLERDGIETGVDVEAVVAIARWLTGLLGHEFDGYLHRTSPWP
jgi:isopropylmalate/homocitrate/citramalate synthase